MGKHKSLYEVLKHTTVVHVLAGLLTAVALFGTMLFGAKGIGITAAGVMLAIGFFIYELWESKEIGDAGYKDYWEFLFSAFLGVGILIILAFIGVI